jgi:phosphoribosylanthranilate isomerase
MENAKFKNFLENAKLLNGRFRVVPLLYGSLGLEQITEANLHSNDINILIPEEFITGDKWLALIDFLEENGYTLIDENTHAFTKEDIEYSYAPIEELKTFAGIDPKDIGIYEKSGVRYKSLSLDQYLTVYQKSQEKYHNANIQDKKAQEEEKVSFIKSKM